MFGIETPKYRVIFDRPAIYSLDSDEFYEMFDADDIDGWDLFRETTTHLAFACDDKKYDIVAIINNGRRRTVELFDEQETQLIYRTDDDEYLIVNYDDGDVCYLFLFDS